MKGQKIGEIGVSSRGMYMCNIAGIMPNGVIYAFVDIIPKATADIPKLCDIASEGRDNIGKSKNLQ